MTPFFLFLVPPLVGIGFFFYFFLRRICRTLEWGEEGKKRKIILMTLSVLLAAVTSVIFSSFGIVAIFLLHVVGVGLVFQGINGILRLCLKEKYQNGLKFWKLCYGSGLYTILGAIAAVLLGVINLNNVVMTGYTIQTDKDIREEGYRIALLADIHYGVSLDGEELSKLCEEINRQQPDLVILCGDIVDSSTAAEEMRELFSILGTLQSEFGTFFVYGNHDRTFSMMKNSFTNEELADSIRSNGITILQDDSRQITEDLLLVGREDRSHSRTGQERKTVGELLKNADPADFILMLDHQPSEYAEQGESGTDLLVSGHTHGGQLFPLNLLMRIIPFNDGTYGTYALSNGGTALITSGVAGWNFPIKTAAPAEYVMIDLKKH